MDSDYKYRSLILDGFCRISGVVVFPQIEQNP